MSSCCDARNESDIPSSVSAYYRDLVAGTRTLATDCCTTCACSSAPSARVSQALSCVPESSRALFFGCGSPLPEVAMGCARVVDLGCGTGRDCFAAGALVGACGRVVGVDMTQESLDIAKSCLDEHAQLCGYAASNVDFRLGRIEETGIEDGFADVVISNCVINLAADKERVCREVFRILRPGGELFFSDVFVDRPVPAELQEDRMLWGECLSGAMHFEEFERVMKEIGFLGPWTVDSNPVSVSNPDVEAKLSSYNLQFTSRTIRAFRPNPEVLSGLGDAIDSWSGATYVGGKQGTNPDETFRFSDALDFLVECEEKASKDVLEALASSRYRSVFDFS